MRKVLVANYYTGTTDPDVDGTSYAFAVADEADRAKLIEHCKAELTKRFSEDGEAFTLRDVVHPLGSSEETTIDLAFDAEVEDDGEDAWNTYFVIESVDYLD